MYTLVSLLSLSAEVREQVMAKRAVRESGVLY